MKLQIEGRVNRVRQSQRKSLSTAENSEKDECSTTITTAAAAAAIATTPIYGSL